jgi:hypothetical protein
MPPPAKKLPPVVLLAMTAGAALFAATAAFALGPALFPRQPGTFSVAQLVLTGVAGMLGAVVGAGLANRWGGRR